MIIKSWKPQCKTRTDCLAIIKWWFEINEIISPEFNQKYIIPKGRGDFSFDVATKVGKPSGTTKKIIIIFDKEAKKFDLELFFKIWLKYDDPKVCYELKLSEINGGKKFSFNSFFKSLSKNVSIIKIWWESNTFEYVMDEENFIFL